MIAALLLSWGLLSIEPIHCPSGQIRVLFFFWVGNLLCVIKHSFPVILCTICSLRCYFSVTWNKQVDSNVNFWSSYRISGFDFVVIVLATPIGSNILPTVVN